MSKLLDVGTELYFVTESIADRAFRDMSYHYEITHGKISGIIRGGFTQYKVPTVNRFGHGSCLHYPKTTDVGKCVWLTYAEAVEAAERESDVCEKTWAKYMKEPLLRPWREE